MDDPAIETPFHQDPRRNALYLADIQSASMIDGDITPSEDEATETQALELETVQSAIGVSIGQQQTRLASPNTSAAEKAAALDGFADDGQWSQSRTAEQDAAQSEAIIDQSGPSYEYVHDLQAQPQILPPDRLPSPWRAGPKKLRVEGLGSDRHAMRDSLTSSRRRAMSGGPTTETLKKYINFSLPSMPKTPNLLNFSLPSLSVALDNAYGTPVTPRQSVVSTNIPSQEIAIGQNDGSPALDANNCESTSQHSNPPPPRHCSTEPIPQPQVPPESFPSSDSNTVLPSEDVDRWPRLRPRRSNSEGSLLLYRPKSIAPSLGDDARFEHVQGQVNSRLKAFKDSWQDANFKFPALPTMSDFGFGPREDMFKLGRSGTAPLRGWNADSSKSSSSLGILATSNGFSRAGSTKLPRAKDSSTNVSVMSSSATPNNSHFTRALQELTGDLVVLGGYRGSVLRSAEAPNRQLWVPIKVGLNLRKVDLEVGLNPEDEETEEDRIIPAGMLTHIGPIDISRRLFKRLRASENVKSGDLRVHDYGYDWRLSPHILSKRLIQYLRDLPCNQPGVPPEKRGAIVVAHSLGGLITRHAINQHPELIAGVVYAGVPQTCVNILGPLRNGDDVLLSSRVLTAQVNFTIRTSYALLPLDGKCFINKRTKEEYPVDFFDINTWAKYSLSPCIAPPLPHPNTAPVLRSASGLLNAMSQALPNLPGRKSSLSTSKGSSTGPTRFNSTSEKYASRTNDAADVARTAVDTTAEGGAQTTGMTPQMNNQAHKTQDYTGGAPNPAVAVTIPHDKAVAYLTRTLAEVKKFKQELAHRPEHTAANAYPPIALIYGKSTPTVYGAKVESREAIKRADAYDELAFASGDGVVLARAAMVPEGYSVARGGVVSSDRGHVTLLGDLQAVGRCLVAVMAARKNGVGLGEGTRKAGIDGLSMAE